MDNTERLYVLALLGEEPTEADITHAAAALVQLRAENEVRTLLSRETSLRGSAKVGEGMRFYPFLSPPAKATISKDANGNEVMTQPMRQQYRVRLADLAAFCKEFGLDPKALAEVGEGKTREYRGWVRAPWSGNLFEVGRPWRAPRDTDEAPRPKGPRKQTVYAMPGPPIQYTPSK